MKTKQQVIDFLESKLGTKVKCVGNPSLDGQCVTLIKSLMEFLGVPDPYKPRGNANTCVSTYLKEGIAEPGTGFISVFSNKNMAGGTGHVWVNAGDGAGTYYESNGQKPLIVTKGKTYSYDNVCNFDKYITKEGDATMPNYYPANEPHIDLNNPESVKAAVDIWVRLQKGEFVDKSKYDADLKEAKESCDARISDGRTAEKLDTIRSVSRGVGLPETITDVDSLVTAILGLIDQSNSGQTPIGSQPTYPPKVLKLAEGDELKRNGVKWLPGGQLEASYQETTK